MYVFAPPMLECVKRSGEIAEAGKRMGTTRDQALDAVLERLIAAYLPERVFLFGSRARDDSGPDSDYDILVIVPDDAPLERRRSRLAYEKLWGTGTAADVLVWTSGYFESRVHLNSSLAASVIREGKLLYAA